MSHFDLAAKLAADANLPNRVVQALVFSDSINLDTPENTRAAVARASEICGIVKAAASAYKARGIDPEIEMARVVKGGAAAPAYRAAVLNKLAEWDMDTHVDGTRSADNPAPMSTLDEMARQYYAERKVKAEKVAVLSAKVKALEQKLHER
ncbi:hypothetical protein FHT32_004493 [Variovorax sp. SG517]|uniref:hypothetical protein n=1 Tax=Variovorax sp. SG517 TaxID=2587117 RepID=UPI00159E053F|nr:hypothetical protein [Variovorax sp. SG517]NVM90836.1 hypothetical protein [Variovorax sp. SG517]